MATRRGFLRRIISAGAVVPLAALPQPKGDSPEVAQLKQTVANLEARRFEILDTLATLRQNWSIQTVYPRPLYEPVPDSGWKWEPGKLLEMPASPFGRYTFVPDPAGLTQSRRNELLFAKALLQMEANRRASQRQTPSA